MGERDREERTGSGMEGGGKETRRKKSHPYNNNSVQTLGTGWNTKGSLLLFFFSRTPFHFLNRIKRTSITRGEIKTTKTTKQRTWHARAGATVVTVDSDWRASDGIDTVAQQ